MATSIANMPISIMDPTKLPQHLQTTAPRKNTNTNTNKHQQQDPEPDYLQNYPKVESEPTTIDHRDVGTLDSWVPRHPSLVRLTGKHPFNCEPPLDSLMHHGFITPSYLHYVRNHGHVPRTSWDSWHVEVSGLVEKPMVFKMEEIVEGFPARELPVTLVCAGNRRKEQNMVRKTVGFNWGAAGISTAVWRGARLLDVLERCGVTRKRGLHVCFEGKEDLPGGGGSKYGTSIPLELAMDPARDILVAYMMNGGVMPPDHGYPLRMIIPGFIGGRMVKWLTKIVVAEEESDNHYHFKDNRVLPPNVLNAEVADEEGWWYKPDYIINDLNTNSAITTPSHDEILPINSGTMQRPYVMKGYAYSGGGKKVTRVELTLDGGDTWLVGKVEYPEKPTEYGKYWCWCFWSVEVEVLDLLGAKEIAVRAWDNTHNTQPQKLIWNLMGMMNNCWFRVKINICRPNKGEIGLVFEHPTQPGNISGGWMARQKHIQETTTEQKVLKKSTSTPFLNTSTTKQYSMSNVRKHSSKDSAWIVVHGHVYDCTAFLNDHPGGSDSILINAGTDVTEEFEAIHSDKAKAMLETYRIGELITTGYTSDTSVHGLSNFSNLTTITESAVIAPTTLVNPREKFQCKLISKTSISHNVRLFRFALPSANHVLGLPVGKHIFLCVTIDGKLCIRAYTPTSKIDEVGHFDLVVKIYFKDVDPKFPRGGLMSQHLDQLEIGSIVDVKGPLGHIEYMGNGNFMVKDRVKRANKLAMLAGGTGITPIYQVMQAVLRDPEDQTQMWVVCANRSEDDVLLKEELDKWEKEHPTRVKVWHIVDKAKREGWPYSVGFLTEQVLREHIPVWSEGVLALACGPPPMLQFGVKPNLSKLGYDVEELLVF